MHGIEVLRWLAITSIALAGLTGFVVGIVLVKHKKVVLEALADRYHVRDQSHSGHEEFAGLRH